MLSPLTQIAITLLHDIAMHEPHEAIGHCTSPEELRYIYTRLEQKGMICRKEKATEKATEKAAEDAGADTYTTCSYKLCRPLCEISLLEVLEAINGHLNCNHPHPKRSTPATERWRRNWEWSTILQGSICRK